MLNNIVKVDAYEPKQAELGAEITIATKKSRKTFHLTKPLDSEDHKPLAIESFAVDPELYNQWLDAAQQYCQKQD
tara:strand:- start:500 stop:724 length:225 start_codon:yes stop_codon:yes gene_type:complete